MSRKSTAIWIVGAVVVVGAGIGVAAVAATHPAADALATPSSHSAPSSHSTAAASRAPSAGPTAATPTATTSATSAPVDGSTPGADASPSSTTPATTPATAVKTVTPSMSYYSFTGSTLTLGGGVSGLVDSGGTCVVSVTRGATTVRQSFAASAGPSSTDCGAMAITSAEFTPGSWNVVISYSSPRASGTSGPASVSL